MRAECLPDWPWANPDAPAQAARLLAHAKAAGWRVIHVHHTADDPSDGFHPANPLSAAMAKVAPRPGEEIVVKTGSSDLIATDLAQRVAGAALVICGGEANMWVASTVRMAGNLGHAVTVVADALVCFPRRAMGERVFPPDLVLDMSLANMRGFARIQTLQDLIA